MKPAPSATQLQQEQLSPAPPHTRHDHTGHHHGHAPTATVSRTSPSNSTSPMVSGVFRRLTLAAVMAIALWLALGWALK